MKASIIIPTYNREEILTLTLESLCQQNNISQNDYEVIVCDDGSTDNTRQNVESFSSRLQLKYLYQEDAGYRVALARNKGIRASSGEIIILVDSGVCVSSDFVSSHIKEHMDPSINRAVIGYIYGYNYTMRSSDLTDDFDFNDPDATIRRLSEKGDHLDIREANYQLADDDLSTLFAPWTLFWTTNVSFRKNLVVDVGLFNESFTGWGVEDIELAYRFYKNQAKFTLCRNAAALHYPHERDIGKQKQTNLKNRQLFYHLHPDPIVNQYMNATALGFNLELGKMDREL